MLLAVLGVDFFGISSQHLFAQHIWDTVGLERLARFTGLFLAAAVPILLLVPWSFAAFVASLMVLGAVLAVGPLPVVAVALFLVSSNVVGRALARPGRDKSWPHVATLAGIAIYIALMTLLSFFPVNYPLVWVGILLVPVALNWRSLALPAMPELRSWCERCAAAFFAFVMLMHWIVVLGPEKSADGLSMHLAVATNIANRHMLTFQPATLVWSVMPKGADLAYGIVTVLGGEYAARLLNFAVLLMLAGLIYAALRRALPPAVSLFLAALFATTPLVQLVTGSLFVENLLAAMILGAFLALWEFAESGRGRWLYTAALLGGGALAVKLWAAVFIALAAPFAVWEADRRRAALAGAAAIAILAVTGLPMYAIAWWKTGNPIFPFKNEIVHSSLLDPHAIFQDNEFRQPLTWKTPYDLAFRTHAYYEGQNRTLGFPYTLVLPLGILGVFFTFSRRSLASLVIAAGAAIAILATEPNLRYVYAAMPLLFLPFGALLEWLRPGRILYRTVIGLLIAGGLLNLYFMPGSSWYHKDFHMRSPFSQAARQRYLSEQAPIRVAMFQFNRAHPGASIFQANDEDLADPLGDVYAGGWHQFNRLLQLRRATSVGDLAALFEQWNVHYFSWRKNDPGEQRDPPVLSEFLDSCTALEFQVDQIRVSRFDGAECAGAGQ